LRCWAFATSIAPVREAVIMAAMQELRTPSNKRPAKHQSVPTGGRRFRRLGGAGRTQLSGVVLATLVLGASGGVALSHLSPSAVTEHLPISVESSDDMRAAGNNGPSSSVLVPAECQVRGSTVSAHGTYRGGFAPEVYRRYGDVVDLYLFTSPTNGYSGGHQEAVLSSEHSPPIYLGTWTVVAPVDSSLGHPARCVVAAQPTHDFEGAGNAY